MATQGEVADHLDLSSRRVRTLMTEGVLPKGARGNHDLVACRVAYIRHLRDVASGHKSQDGKLDLTAERARLAAAQADEKEMKNAVTRGSLLGLDEYLGATIVVMAAIRVRIMSLGAKLQYKLAGESEARECKRILDVSHREVLEQLSELGVVATPNGDVGDTGELGERADLAKRAGST